MFRRQVYASTIGPSVADECIKVTASHNRKVFLGFLILASDLSLTTYSSYGMWGSTSLSFFPPLCSPTRAQISHTPSSACRQLKHLGPATTSSLHPILFFSLIRPPRITSIRYPVVQLPCHSKAGAGLAKGPNRQPHVKERQGLTRQTRLVQRLLRGAYAGLIAPTAVGFHKTVCVKNRAGDASLQLMIVMTRHELHIVYAMLLRRFFRC